MQTIRVDSKAGAGGAGVKPRPKPLAQKTEAGCEAETNPVTAIMAKMAAQAAVVKYLFSVQKRKVDENEIRVKILADGETKDSLYATLLVLAAGIQFQVVVTILKGSDSDWEDIQAEVTPNSGVDACSSFAVNLRCVRFDNKERIEALSIERK